MGDWAETQAARDGWAVCVCGSCVQGVPARSFEGANAEIATSAPCYAPLANSTPQAAGPRSRLTAGIVSCEPPQPVHPDKYISPKPRITRGFLRYGTLSTLWQQTNVVKPEGLRTPTCGRRRKTSFENTAIPQVGWLTRTPQERARPRRLAARSVNPCRPSRYQWAGLPLAIAIWCIRW